MFRTWKTSSNESNLMEIVENEQGKEWKTKKMQQINDEVAEPIKCERKQRKAGAVK